MTVHPPLAITACSVLTPLDEMTPACTTWQALCAGTSLTNKVAVDDALLEADTSLDRSIRLGLSAARRLNVPLNDAALFCGTSKGPITTFLVATEALRSGKTLSEAQAQHVALGVGSLAAFLKNRLKLHGPSHTSVAACSSGLHALHRAASAIRQGECARALVVAADASLHPLFDASFQRLGVLSPRDRHGQTHCRPFDPAGEGFFLSEAAAAIVLEAAPPCSSAPPIAWLHDTWIGGDSTALVAVDPETHTLRHGIEALFSTPSEMPAFVHAHATGTAHDAYELAAIRVHFPSHIPVFSHKQWLGHSLGAAGLVSLALSALSHHHRRTPANHPVPPHARSLTIAQGFGGHIALVTLTSA